MNKLIYLLAAASSAVVGVTGCVEKPKPTPQPPMQPTRLPGPTTITAVPQTPALPPALPPEGRVVEIITKPRLTTRPSTTNPAGGGVGATAARGGGRAPDAPIAAANVPAPLLTLDSFARVDSSVSCGPLVRLLAMKFNHIPYDGFAGYGALDFTPKLPEGTDPDKVSNDVLGREPAGTAAAITRLLAGEVDLVLTPRQPTADEVAAATAKKLRIRSDLVATEALVFTVNAANPIGNLSKAQLSQIFTGSAKLWKDLGEGTVPAANPISGEPITVAYRARGTGSEELLRQLLLQGQPMPELPVSRALSASKLVLDASVEDSQTIGFSVFAYASNMKRDGRVKVIAIDGVVPEPGRVATGEYPLTTPIYVLTRSDLGSDTDLYKLRQWLSGMDGQKVLAEAGYMPISTEAWTAVRLMGK